MHEYRETITLALMRRWGRLRTTTAILLFCSSTITAAGSNPDDLQARVAAARASGDFKVAVAALQQLVIAAPQRTDYSLLLAETLAWDKRLPDAEKLYRDILARGGPSREANLGLARVLMWAGRYDEAAAAFNQMLRQNRGDNDALEGRATTAYWSGDFRGAARDFQRLLALDPNRAFARQGLSEIRRSALPEQRIDVEYLDDDQPYRLLRNSVTGSFSSDPQTRWSVVFGNYGLEAPIQGAATLPFAQLANRTVLPRMRLTFEGAAGMVRYGDAASRPTARVALTRQITKATSLTLRADRLELLATATGMRSHPSLTTLAAQWHLETEGGGLAAAEAARLRYFDGNRGVAAYAYALVPVLRRGASRLCAGASATVRDSRDSRFGFSAVSSARAGGGFDYSYRGEYDPYWAPQHLRETRAVVTAQAAVSRTTLTLHVDAGLARDRAIGFGPTAGATPLPSAIYSFAYDREFHPYRAALTTAIPLRTGFTAEIGFENSRTAFYRGKTFHASMVRHR